ncbi:MAG: bile acid:sodium symporter [Desulfofustis sp.]|nr:bile acid:sodium symporter [Desulfofustis sp.]
MLSFLKQQWFIFSIAVAAAVGFVEPGWGAVLQDYDVFSIGIFLSFFATGLCLETRAILRQVRSVKAPVAALLSALILYPLLAWGAALPLLPAEFVIGVCIIATAPVTVSSGTIMTAIARGNVPLSLLICILTNFLAIFTIPAMLKVLLNAGQTIDLPILPMLGGLILKALLPLILGQFARPAVKGLVKRYSRHLAIFQSGIIILIIFNAVSNSADSLTDLGSSLIGVTVFMVCLHGFMLGFNYLFARLIRLDHASTVAFTIHTSQKTLAVSYIVWAGSFAADYPAAFIPAIICQLTQMTVGTFVADFFKNHHPPAGRA